MTAADLLVIRITTPPGPYGVLGAETVPTIARGVGIGSSHAQGLRVHAINLRAVSLPVGAFCVGTVMGMSSEGMAVVAVD